MLYASRREIIIFRVATSNILQNANNFCVLVMTWYYACLASPYWKQNKISNIDAMEEDDVRFECLVSGIPKPTITWTVNGIPVDGNVALFVPGYCLLCKLPD
jgi:Immunoglobulin I-set domain